MEKALPDLNLPLPPLRFKKSVDLGLLVWDFVRKKYIKLTPEEWVRQHFLHFLVQNDYPPALLRTESKVRQHGLYGRTDIVAYSKQAQPFLLVECKAPDKKLMTDTHLQQLLAYNTRLQCPFLALSNGFEHIYLAQSSTNVQQLEVLPIFG